ncbi:hypothetical protein BHF71_08550 [Vulcanibacillus modesticaldus]|uniref:UDP-N-acetylmuramoyl-tripeptide--D-alanyl-D-alanine ligase n=1 Tax=Vulcanibacillus modesticaldus TaxID=337097 RepID=A0A1D2YV22_9BACI|nr:UDP-N-acetylmuramoyl-tripeptide--D-alanyl-D-alanine ligase [Vulcanibacillus modesticaldus]OEF99523.1 hypothetical protein BHF71_08550 [Vulcanibacillus modesticaldus]
MKLELKEIIQAVKGRLDSNTDNILVSGISTDSRDINKGDLFIPLVGERFDGHSYIKQAEENGAIAAMWQESRPIPDTNIPLILVSDTLKALQHLARAYRERINPIVVGVTGSNGKTTTKDLIASILALKYRVHKTKGNLNNHIGVPLTILSMPEDAEVAVIEMGMSAPGEIEVLSLIAKPDIVVITNIGESHIEFLKTRENIAKAKLEILKGLQPKGLAILPGDESLIRAAITDFDESIQVIWVGKEAVNNSYPIEIRMDDTEQVNFVDNEQTRYSLPLLGVHNVINALMAIQIGKKLNVPISDIKKGLANLQLTGMRLEKLRGRNGSLILNDTYNASPTSMKASLRLLASLKQYSKKIAVLGDMLELGNHAHEYHLEVGEFCADLGIDKLIVTGSLGELIAKGAIAGGLNKNDVYYIKDLNQIPEIVLQFSNPQTAILVKGSRGVRLEKVVDRLV